MKPSETPTRPVMDVRGPASRPVAPVAVRPKPTPTTAQTEGVPVRPSPMTLRQPPADQDDTEQTAQQGDPGTAQQQESATPQPQVAKPKKAPSLVVIPITLTIIAMVFVSSVAIYMYLQS